MLLERTRQVGRLAKGMARVERRDIGVGQFGRLGEFRLEPVDQRRPITVEHPQRQPQRPHILAAQGFLVAEAERSEEHTSELQSLMRISYAVFCLKKQNNIAQL